MSASVAFFESDSACDIRLVLVVVFLITPPAQSSGRDARQGELKIDTEFVGKLHAEGDRASPVGVLGFIHATLDVHPVERIRKQIVRLLVPMHSTISCGLSVNTSAGPLADVPPGIAQCDTIVACFRTTKIKLCEFS